MAKSENYYALMELIEKKYPGKCFLKPKEAAEVMSCNIKTITSAIKRKYNPLPAKVIGGGVRNKSYVIPVPALCSWAAN